MSIDERPAIVDERSRVGDWEVNAVQGKQGRGTMVSLLERKSRLYLVRYVANKTVCVAVDTIIDILTRKGLIDVMAADNGSEFV